MTTTTTTRVRRQVLLAHKTETVAPTKAVQQQTSSLHHCHKSLPTEDSLGKPSLAHRALECRRCCGSNEVR
jgi:hypothetical protein